MKSIVIVESPAKAKTIEKYLGKDFKVLASVGHVRDLPKSNISVDIENNFAPTYKLVKDRKKVVDDLKKAVDKAKDVYLAPDPDREGEAIAWHLSEVLNIQDRAKRIEFNEITKDAVQKALKNPRLIDMNRVNAQQARRILDRIVGYKISPLLWKKIQKGLSAGRVQSVALRLICEREAAIKAFNQEEYWTIEADFLNKEKKAISAILKQYKGKNLKIADKKQADKILSDLKDQEFIVSKIEKKERKKNPAPPFITSTLQQEASRKLGYSAKKTMMIAQQLYEGVDIKGELLGLITYMRTDSTRISDEALALARNTIQSKYGKEYLPSTVRIYKTKKSAQDAHEAVRPSYIDKSPEELKSYLSKEQFLLYQLIWQRFIASQMSNAILDTTAIDIKASDYLFRANGYVIKFLGFMSVYIEGFDQKQESEKTEADFEAEQKERILPNLIEKEKLDLKKIKPEQHFTQPPPRYTEASLVKILEEKGIGRPSTYASIMGAIQDRGYVIRDKKTLLPTEIGITVNTQLVMHFPKIVDTEFTANMENQLDEIMEGKKIWQNILSDFYTPFAETLDKAYNDMEKLKPEDKPTDEVCEKCSSPMVIKKGRFGEFMACSNFPKCKNTKSLLKAQKTTGVKCPDCGADIIEKRTKKGITFYGCAKYPDCKFASWQKPLEENCEKCGNFLVQDKADKKCPKCGNK